uniref:Integrin-alpha FG-GAP repeat-containing protein 2 n=1 Tax=Mesocestoides corti TaxID=53468 RepID=A0A5K3FKN4_MESCO
MLLNMMVTCVTAGRLCFKEKTSIVVLCADAQCHIFDATFDSSSHLQSICCQKLACNAKDARILEGDGPCDMAVAYSDRVVRLFRWVPQSKTDKKPGELVLLIKWELAGQVSRISLHSTSKASNLILASQPGGGFAFLQKKFETYESRMCPTLVYHPPRKNPNQNTETRTWLVGDLRCNTAKQSTSLIGLCLADGTLQLISADLHQSEAMWSVSLPVNGELFGLSKFDLTNSDADELAVCCWDGSTYICNQNADILHFPVGQACQAFTAGRLAISPKVNVPVLVYATCEQSTLIFYNLDVNSVPSYSLHNALSNRPDVLEKFAKYHISYSDPIKLRKAIRFLLYHPPRHHH